MNLATVLEVDARSLGGGAEVVWLCDEDGHVIVVSSTEGKPACVLGPMSGLEARELYRHPFADRRVPDIYVGTPDSSEMSPSPDELRRAGAI